MERAHVTRCTKASIHHIVIFVLLAGMWVGDEETGEREREKTGAKPES